MAEKKVSKSMKKQILNIGFLVLLVAVTLIVLFTANDISFGDIFTFLKNCNPWWIVGAVALMIGSVLFEAVSIHFILRGLGEKPRFYGTTCYTAADIYYSAITPSATGGQPAAAYYMVKDGIKAGKASFGLIFNLTAYTLSIIIIGVVALAFRPSYFSVIDGWFPKFLVVIGFVIQGLLLAFFIGCMFWGSAVKKAGNGIISLLVKIHIVKNPDKWREKLAREVDLYKNCLYEIKNHPGMSFINVFCNLGQRVCHVLIPCFVLLAAAPHTDFLGLFTCSAFVIIGYNSIPLPGGVGVYEYLYPSIYCAVGLGGGDAFILSALMVSRFISYYLSMIVCGIYTLIYHVQIMRRPSATAESKEGEELPAQPCEEDGGAESEECIVEIAEKTEIGEDHGREEEQRGDATD